MVESAVADQPFRPTRWPINTSNPFRPPDPTDITYLRSWEGWVYLAAVQDAFSRTIVGWAMAEHMKAELVTDALQMALARHQPEAGVIHRSDQGPNTYRLPLAPEGA
jgi:transposase InsO family protein